MLMVYKDLMWLLTKPPPRPAYTDFAIRAKDHPLQVFEFGDKARPHCCEPLHGHNMPPLIFFFFIFLKQLLARYTLIYTHILVFLFCFVLSLLFFPKSNAQSHAPGDVWALGFGWNSRYTGQADISCVNTKDGVLRPK